MNTTVTRKLEWTRKETRQTGDRRRIRLSVRPSQCPSRRLFWFGWGDRHGVSVLSFESLWKKSSSSVRVSLRVSLQRIVAWLLHSLRASGHHVSLCAPLPFVELRGKRRLGVLGHRVQEALRDVFRDQILAEQ